MYIHCDTCTYIIENRFAKDFWTRIDKALPILFDNFVNKITGPKKYSIGDGRRGDEEVLGCLLGIGM